MKPYPPLPPDAATAIAIASIAVHAEEFLSRASHPADATAIRGLLALPYVKTYLDEMRKLSLVPVRR